MMASLVRPMARMKSGTGGGDRRGADTILDVLEREVQFVRLVQCDLEHARGDLHGAGKACGRREEDRQVGRLHAAGRRDLAHDRRRRGLSPSMTSEALLQWST